MKDFLPFSFVLLCADLLSLGGCVLDARGHGRLRSAVKDEGPRPLWTYWGSPTTPAIVDLCIDTLRYHAGPGWEVNVLTKDSAMQHVSKSDLPSAFDSMKPSFQADALRLALLRRHGGMWIDATTIATRNFSDWVGDAFAGGRGFYGFYIEHYTGPDGPPLVASWAVAVLAPEDPVMVAWHEAYVKLWENRTSAEDITADHFFDGADISNVNPLMQDYLNVELVLLVLLQRNAELKSHFDETATVVSAEKGPYAIQTWMGMTWFGGKRCRPVTKRLRSLPAQLQQQLAHTPLVKLRHQDRKFLEEMTAQELLSHRSSVLGSLLLANGAPAPPDRDVLSEPAACQ